MYVVSLRIPPLITVYHNHGFCSSPCATAYEMLHRGQRPGRSKLAEPILYRQFYPVQQPPTVAREGIKGKGTSLRKMTANRNAVPAFRNGYIRSLQTPSKVRCVGTPSGRFGTDNIRSLQTPSKVRCIGTPSRRFGTDNIRSLQTPTKVRCVGTPSRRFGTDKSVLYKHHLGILRFHYNNSVDFIAYFHPNPDCFSRISMI